MDCHIRLQATQVLENLRIFQDQYGDATSQTAPQLNATLTAAVDELTGFINTIPAESDESAAAQPSSGFPNTIST